MNGFEKRATLIKEKIMKTTLDMLKTWEPNRIRVADIAKAANVSQVTIYNYFGSKEALLRDVIKDYLDRSINDFLEYMCGEYTVKEKIERLILQEKESYNDLTPDWAHTLLIEDDEMARYLEKEYNEKIIPLLLQLIEDGKKSGEISNQVSSEAFLTFLNMYLKHSKELIEIARRNGNMDLFDGMVHIFFYGICGKP